MSILIFLVIMASLWGLCGAILSVPFLGIIKISCDHIDHPTAKACLNLVREADFDKERAERKKMVLHEREQAAIREAERIEANKTAQERAVDGIEEMRAELNDDDDE